MARPLRIEYPGAFYHITTRGNQRQKIFLKNKDFELFLNVIDKAFERYLFYIHCFVLMGNHYHLLIETPDGNLSKIMQFINSQYTHFFNFVNNKSGHVFQGRYKSLLVDKDSYLLGLSRYIHLNPLKAGLAKKLEDYRWSSFPYYAGLRPSPKWLRFDFVLSNWDINDIPKSVEKYKKFISSKIDNSEDVFKNIYGQAILGDEDFISNTLKTDLKQAKNISYAKKFIKRAGMLYIIDMISEEYDVDKDIILKGGIRNNIARQAALYFIRKFCSETNIEIASCFENIGFTAISKASQKIEKKRKIDNTLDKQLSEIENKIKSKVNA